MNTTNTIKTIIVPSMAYFHEYLQTRIPKTDIFTYRDKVVVRHTTRDTLMTPSSIATVPYHSLRAWKSNSVFDVWYDEMSGNDNFIAALDYVVEDDRVKIEYLNINDKEYQQHYFRRAINEVYMNDEDAQLLTKNLISYAENVARDNEKTRIVIDVHENLRIFDKFYKNNGFVATRDRCIDNSFWIQAVKEVDAF